MGGKAVSTIAEIMNKYDGIALGLEIPWVNPPRVPYMQNRLVFLIESSTHYQSRIIYWNIDVLLVPQ